MHIKHRSSYKYVFSGYEYDGYRVAYDLHTHTTYSHGIGSIAENVEQARKLGLSKIAITDHGPGHLTYGIKREAIPKMREEIEALKAKYDDIEILFGVEANIQMHDNHLDVAPDEISQFDLIHGGYHYGITGGRCVANWVNWHTGKTILEKSLIRTNTEMVVAALHENNLTILTHPGDKGPFDIEEIARACQETDTLMEVSTWHSHMTLEELQLCRKYDVKFIVSSDAHMPARVGDAAAGIKRIFEAGIEPERVVNIAPVK